MNDNEKINNLFKEGINFYKSGDFFEGHESWEELWSDFYLPDRIFIQGLIQLSVSFVHLENNNLKGAKSLLNKCIEKFEQYSDCYQRGINVRELLKQIYQVRNVYDTLSSNSKFDLKLIPKL